MTGMQSSVLVKYSTTALIASIGQEKRFGQKRKKISGVGIFNNLKAFGACEVLSSLLVEKCLMTFPGVFFHALVDNIIFNTKQE